MSLDLIKARTSQAEKNSAITDPPATKIRTFGEDLKVFPVPHPEPRGTTTVVLGPSNKKDKKKNKGQTAGGVHAKPKTLRKYITHKLIELDQDWAIFAHDLAFLEGLVDDESLPKDNEQDHIEDSIEVLEDSLRDCEAKVEELFDIGAHFGISRHEMVRLIPKMNQTYENFVKNLPITDVKG